MEDVKLLMEESGNELYKSFFVGNDFVMNHFSDIHQTWNSRYKDHSKNSFSFVDTKGKTKEVLKKDTKGKIKELFIIDSDDFDNMFKAATKNNILELRRISTLHSSSLIALLCFYNISNKSADKQLKIKLNGEDCTFTSCILEFKNAIKNSFSPSNIDVTLTGTDSNGKSVVLFLESKFSEYLSHAKCEGISDKVYGDIYTKLKKRIDGLNIAKETGAWSISATSERPQAYCEGIKQMISHYQGIKDGFIGSDNDKFNHIYLGEILFKFEDNNVDKRNENFINYTRYYKSLAKRLNEINNDERFKVLVEPLTYQDIFKDFKLDDSVQKFYGIGKK